MDRGVVDDILDICWEKNNYKSQGKDAVSIEQIFSLIQEVEKLISRSVFHQDEMQILKEMSLRPTSQLQKSELPQFLTKLTQTSSLETLLQDRSGLGRYQLQRIVDDHKLNKDRRKPLSPYNFRNSFSKFDLPKVLDFASSMPFMVSPPIRTSRPVSALRPLRDSHTSDTITGGARPILVSSPVRKSRPSSKALLSPPISPPSFGTFGSKTERLNDESVSLKQTFETQKQKIEYLDSKMKDLQRYSESLERQLTSKLGNLKDGKLVKELMNKNADQDRIIRNLETLCDKYQQDLKYVAKQEDNNQKLIDLLRQNVIKQDQLAEKLKIKLHLNQPEEKELKQFLARLPFIKQYYMFFKYGNDQRNIGVLMLNLFTLLLTATVLLNLIKFSYFMLLPLKSGRIGQSSMEYIQEDVLLTEGYVLVPWWQQIEWLEYLMYRINDWKDGTDD